MEIHLAGMNIDHSLLHDMESMLHDAADALARNPADHQKNTELVEKLSRHLASDTITPETISAAYARISRDPRSVDQLRQEALQRVGKARRSNRNIIFGMGHSSVAEHAVFNLDIIGITRLLSEYIQSHRLCSFTEKSQRYIRLETDYIIPPEIRNTSLAKDYETFTRNRFRDYNELCRIICEDPSRDPSLAGEDARYILPLSVTTQMGMTINARTLERLLQRAASSNLQEFREFGKRLFSVIDGIAPSVIKYTEGNRREVDRAAVLSQRVAAVSEEPSDCDPAVAEIVRLIAATPDGDRTVAGALLANATGLSLTDPGIVAYLDDSDRIRDLFRDVFRFMEPWDAAPREFEYAGALFEIVISAAAFAQMKRHRMASMTSGPYDISLDITIPPAFQGTRGEVLFHTAAAESSDITSRIRAAVPGVETYGFLACHRRRLTIQMNARELIHLSRLREDIHAQWDIRAIAREMIRQVRTRLPGCMIPACGKHEFEAYKSSVGLTS